MKLDYPKYEMIFSVQGEDDEALPVVRMIMEKYPDVNAKIIIGQSRNHTSSPLPSPLRRFKWGSTEVVMSD
jgi:cellulose synthase/poly-beta-1,6-N-acetylglucosamine synthase-like glycosyltransferase